MAEENSRIKERSKQGFEKWHKDHLYLLASIEDLNDRSGLGVQQPILEIMKEEIQQYGLDYSKLERTQLVDTEGRVFFRGFNTEIYIQNERGIISIVEVKYKAEPYDFDVLLKLAKLFEQIQGVHPFEIIHGYTKSHTSHFALNGTFTN